MQKYTLPMRAIHWIMAVLIITLLAVGLWMTSLPQDDVNRGAIYGMHKSFGILALIFVLIRVANRMRSEVPAMPKEITYFYAKVSGITIFLLYVCMVAQPVSGFLMSDFSGYPVHFFGIALPSIVEKNPETGKLFVTIHEYLGFALIGLITLHLAGSLKHYFSEKVNLLKRIW